MNGTWNLLSVATGIIPELYQDLWTDQKHSEAGSPMEFQWLGLGSFTAMHMGSIPGWGTKDPKGVAKKYQA